MPTNYVLIDYENVRPKNLELLLDPLFKVFVFVGANQEKIPFDLATAMQSLGNNARYVKISGNGPNALDFHVAFYIGQMSSQEPEAYYHIISKDTGFDPLIEHLKDRKIRVQRQENLAEIPILRLSNAASHHEKVEAIIQNLSGRGDSRPRKLKTLANTINSLFAKKLEEGQLLSLIDELQKRKFIVVSNDSVTYMASN